MGCKKGIIRRRMKKRWVRAVSSVRNRQLCGCLTQIRQVQFHGQVPAMQSENLSISVFSNFFCAVLLIHAF